MGLNRHKKITIYLVIFTPLLVFLSCLVLKKTNSDPKNVCDIKIYSHGISESYTWNILLGCDITPNISNIKENEINIQAVSIGLHKIVYPLLKVDKNAIKKFINKKYDLNTIKENLIKCSNISKKYSSVKDGYILFFLFKKNNQFYIIGFYGLQSLTGEEFSTLLEIDKKYWIEIKKENLKNQTKYIKNCEKPHVVNFK